MSENNLIELQSCPKCKDGFKLKVTEQELIDGGGFIECENCQTPCYPVKYYAILKIPYSPENIFSEIKTTLKPSQMHLIHIAQKVRQDNACNVECCIYDIENNFVEKHFLAW